MDAIAVSRTSWASLLKIGAWMEKERLRDLSLLGV